MIGLMVIGFYAIFGFLCWGVAGLFFSENNVKSIVAKVTLFFAMALTPFWIYLFQYSYFTIKCDSLEYLSPSEKIEWPTSILLAERINPNVYYEKENGVEVLKYFRKANFDYVIAPRNQRLVNESWDEVKKHNNLIVNPRVSGEVTGSEQIVQSTIYGLLIEKEKRFGIWTKKVSVTDLGSGEKLSGYEEVWQVRDVDSFSNFLLPYNLGMCVSSQVKSDEVLPREALLLNTFGSLKSK